MKPNSSLNWTWPSSAPVCWFLLFNLTNNTFRESHIVCYTLEIYIGLCLKCVIPGSNILHTHSALLQECCTQTPPSPTPRHQTHKACNKTPWVIRIITRLSLKCSAWKGFIKFASKKFSTKFLGPKDILCQKVIFKEKFCSEKILVWKKVLFEKILVQNFFSNL